MPRFFFLPQLLTCLPHVNERASQCKEYFDLISYLLKEKKTAESKEDVANAAAAAAAVAVVAADKKEKPNAAAPLPLAFDADHLAQLLTAKIKQHTVWFTPSSSSLFVPLLCLSHLMCLMVCMVCMV